MGAQTAATAHNGYYNQLLEGTEGPPHNGERNVVLQL